MDAARVIYDNIENMVYATTSKCSRENFDEPVSITWQPLVAGTTWQQVWEQSIGTEKTAMGKQIQ